jgi:hypothetical protein
MRAFQVYLNGKKLCTAGVGDDGVLSAILTWVRGARNTPSQRSKLVQGEDLFIQVGGLISPVEEHVIWLQRSLRVGDDVRIAVVERAAVDRPKSRKRTDPAQELRAQKKYVRQMAKRFGWQIVPPGKQGCDDISERRPKSSARQGPTKKPYRAPHD